MQKNRSPVITHNSIYSKNQKWEVCTGASFYKFIFGNIERKSHVG